MRSEGNIAYFLREIADSGIFRFLHHAEIAFRLAGKDFQQGGFAGPVNPDQADPFLIVDPGRNLVEEFFVAVLNIELVDG